MSELDYQELRALRSSPGQNARRFTPEVSDARRREYRYRLSTAQARAKVALTKAFPDEYRALYHAAKAEVDAERGPLPGDEVTP